MQLKRPSELCAVDLTSFAMQELIRLPTGPERMDPTSIPFNVVIVAGLPDVWRAAQSAPVQRAQGRSIRNGRQAVGRLEQPCRMNKVSVMRADLCCCLASVLRVREFSHVAMTNEESSR